MSVFAEEIGIGNIRRVWYIQKDTEMGLNALISRNNHEVKSVTSKCICSREDESRHLVESLVVDP